ncbi:MAG: glycosyltransferase family 4 protein [Anaerolineae bacterium]
MRILMIYSTSNLGGAELYAMNLLQVLRDQVEFTVVTPENSFLGGRARGMNLHTIEVPLSYPKLEIAQLLQSTQIIKQQLSHEHFDLIYTHHLSAAMIGQLLSSAWDVPLLFTIDSPYLRPHYEDFIRLTSCYVMSASQSGYQYVLENALCAPERLFMVQPGINLHEFHMQQSKTKTQAFRRFGLDKQPVIGVAARLVQDKGVDRAIYAVHHMKQSGKLSARLMIAGDGEERANLEALVQNLAMQDDVEFMGQLLPEHMPDFYQMMDVYVLATNREGCPISILEAMSSGVPVVATSVGDIPYLVQSGVNGYTIKEPEPLTIAQRVSDILQSDELTRQTLVHNEQIVPEFDNTIQANKVYDIFEQIIQHHGD